jgi:hypothetical protein
MEKLTHSMGLESKPFGKLLLAEFTILTVHCLGPELRAHLQMRKKRDTALWLQATHLEALWQQSLHLT